jgi:hypothetical protein
MGKLRGVISAPTFASAMCPKKHVQLILVILFSVSYRYQEIITGV